MNCKQGDLAVLVMGDWAGSFLRCMEPYNGPWEKGGCVPGWRVEWQTPNDILQDVVADFALRPIRDPGDDARDETLEWLPVPSRDEVTA